MRIPNHEVPKRKETHDPNHGFWIPIYRPTFFPNLRPFSLALVRPLMAGPLHTPPINVPDKTRLVYSSGWGPKEKKLQGKRRLSTANMRQICQKERERERERECVCVCVSLSLSSALIQDSINPRERESMNPPEKNFLNLSSTVEHSLSIGEEFLLSIFVNRPEKVSNPRRIFSNVLPR
jgi:hypothetical protein